MTVTSHARDACTPEETAVVRGRMCPDCGGLLREGPHGNCCVDWLCVNQACGSRFNATDADVMRISDASPNRGAPA